jgi:O-antigen/teichoic acid export membrane protein
MLPIVLAIALFAEQGLKVWLNDEFAANSTRVAQLLVVGVFFNSIGLISQSFVQATGRPDLTAKLHLIELPFYLTYLWFFLHKYGINGAASAWLIRVLISSLVLAVLARLSIKKNQ